MSVQPGMKISNSELQVSLALLLVFFTFLPLPFDMLPMTTG